MERKEHPVPVISGGAETLEFQDEDGNPFKPEDPVDFKLIGVDGDVLKEGTLDGDNYTISLSDVATRKFRVVVDNYVVAESDGFQNLDEEQNESDETEEESEDEESEGEESEGEADDEGEGADDKEAEESEESESDASKEDSDTDENDGQSAGEDESGSKDSSDNSSDDTDDESTDSPTSDDNDDSGEKDE